MSGGRKSLGGWGLLGIGEESLGIGDVMSLAREGSFDGVCSLGRGCEGPFGSLGNGEWSFGLFIDDKGSIVWASENAPVHSANTVGISGASTSAKYRT